MCRDYGIFLEIGDFFFLKETKRRPVSRKRSPLGDLGDQSLCPATCLMACKSTYRLTNLHAYLSTCLPPIIRDNLLLYSLHKVG